MSNFDLLPKPIRLTQENEWAKKSKSAKNIVFSALFGTLERTLTSDLPLRRRPLYTTELPGHILYNSNLWPFAFLQRRGLKRPLRRTIFYPLNYTGMTEFQHIVPNLLGNVKKMKPDFSGRLIVDQRDCSWTEFQKASNEMNGKKFHFPLYRRQMFC